MTADRVEALSAGPLDERTVARAVREADGPLPHLRLPRVLHDSPAAVLLVDLESGSVVHANPAALALTGGHHPLPSLVADWDADADLTTTEGSPLRRGLVARIVAGELVHGEPVLIGGQLRWVTGFPVRDPRAGQAGQALVVFFELDADDGAQVRDRAVVAASLSFTISDPRLPDSPLVFVNPAFERTTGYDREEAVGRNCRFLQGPDTDPAAVERVREVIRSGEHATVMLLNYRKDGSAFWNELSISPVYNAAGELTHHVGIQADVTSRVHIERERERHLEAERALRAAAERAQHRLALLAEATTRLAATLDVDESLDRLLGLVVPKLADWCTVQLLNLDGTPRPLSGRHRDPSRLPRLRALESLREAGLGPGSPWEAVMNGAPACLVTDSQAALDSPVLSEQVRSAYRAVGVTSSMVVPLLARRQVLGVLALHRDGGRPYDEDDLSTAADLARRAALAVDNARLYQREHDVAEQLQCSLLPVLPQVPGLDRAARYLPGSTAAHVGGDWYDLFPLPDGSVGLAIGDVMGHDLAAAASMGQLRSVLQSYAWQGSSPSVVLDRLDQLVQGLGMAQLATCVYGRVDVPAGGAPGRIVLSNAGHLPPVLRSPDGTVRQLGGAPSLLVGAALGTVRDEIEEVLPPGSTLVLCTDGLVEHRGRDIDEGLAALERAVASAPLEDADAICEHLLRELTGEYFEDDVAVLVVRVL